MSSCNICSKTFTRRDNLKRHMIENHRNLKRELPGENANEIKIKRDKKFQFKHPFCMMVVGPSQSGKTVWINDLVTNMKDRIQPVPKHVVFCYSYMQPKYQTLKERFPAIEFRRGIPQQLFDKDEFKDTLVVIDDMMSTVMKNDSIIDLFTKGSHHKKLSVIITVQNLFHQDKGSRTMNLNSQYLVLFKNPRDQQQVETLSRQIYPRKWRDFMKNYEIETRIPHSYIILDFHPKTLDRDRIQTGVIVKEELKERALLASINNKLDTIQKKTLTPAEKISKEMDDTLADESKSLEDRVRLHTQLLVKFMRQQRRNPNFKNTSYSDWNPPKDLFTKNIKKEERSLDNRKEQEIKNKEKNIEEQQLMKDNKEEYSEALEISESEEEEEEAMDDVRQDESVTSSQEIIIEKPTTRAQTKLIQEEAREQQERKNIQTQLNTTKGKTYRSFTDDEDDTFAIKALKLLASPSQRVKKVLEITDM